MRCREPTWGRSIGENGVGGEPATVPRRADARRVALSRLCVPPEILEEGFENPRGFLAEHARLHLETVVQPFLRDEVHHRAARAAEGVLRAEHEAREAPVQERPRAHRA